MGKKVCYSAGNYLNRQHERYLHFRAENKRGNTESVSTEERRDGEESATSQPAGSRAAIGAANQGSLLGLAVYLFIFFRAKYLIASLLA